MRVFVEPLLERDAPLKELCFIEAAVDDDMVVAFVDVFLEKPRLVPIKLQFDACELELGFRGCQALSQLIQSQNCSMEELDIPDNYIGDDGGCLFGKCAEEEWYNEGNLSSG